ncbi:Hypp136 [Branchiostoma lanceolatum]|uniref:Hypp136 protein n=1 Tax=Branchiostoma lanceolatum TaxID=7740 RepID=A0A8J9VS73_BRALA|nr:Hypp136 [Branchiostoma lanceolatum]
MLFLLTVCLGALRIAGAATVPPGQQTTKNPLAGSNSPGLPQLVVQTDKELEVFRTNTVVQSCNFDTVTDRDPPFQISWYKLNADGFPDSAFLTSVHGQEVHVTDRQEELGLGGRVSIQPDGRSLNITDVSVHDEGTYRCEVIVFQPSIAKASSDVNLTVVDFQMRGYIENMVVERGTPVTLTAIVSGSNLPCQNSWAVDGNQPANNYVSEAILLDQNGRSTVTSTFLFQSDTIVTVTFTSYIPSAVNGTLPTVNNDTYENSRTVTVQLTIVFTDFCDCSVATFAAAEAGCTIAGFVLALFTNYVHTRYGFNKRQAISWYSVGYPLIVTLFLGVVVGIPVSFFAVQKVKMDVGSAAVIVISALIPFALLEKTLLKAVAACRQQAQESETQMAEADQNEDHRQHDNRH